MALVTKVSQYSGKEHTLDLDITNEQIARFIKREECIQDIFPNLTPSEREFMLTGITPEEWEEMFNYNEEE